MTTVGVARRFGAVAAIGAALAFNTFAPAVVTTAAADTAIVVGGFGTPSPSERYMDSVLGGTLSGPQWTRIGITYPATGGPLLSGPGAPTVSESVRQGAETTYRTIIDTADEMLVTGTSEGSAVVDAVQAQLVNDPKAPAPDQITFVYTAPLQHHDPVLATSFLWYLQGIWIPIVGFKPQPPVQNSQYDTVVLAGEYDWAADFPDRPWNLLAVANSFMAGLYPSAMSIHGATTLADPDPAKYPVENVHIRTNSKGATITSILVPTARLPVLEPLRDMGIPDPVVDVADKLVRPVVDAGYSRNDARHPLLPRLPPVTKPILGDHAAPLDSDVIDLARQRDESAASTQSGQADDTSKRQQVVEQPDETATVAPDDPDSEPDAAPATAPQDGGDDGD